jgi:hypothetical protein
VVTDAAEAARYIVIPQDNLCVRVARSETPNLCDRNEKSIAKDQFRLCLKFYPVIDGPPKDAGSMGSIEENPRGFVGMVEVGNA